jgi:hypothetical protein
MKKLLTKIKKNAQTAYAYFVSEIEIDAAKEQIKLLKANGDTERASIITAYIKAYETDSEYVFKPKAKAKAKPKAKAGKVVLNPRTGKEIYGPYHENGGLGVLDVYADWLEIEYDPMTHVSSRYRIPRLKDTAETRCKYLRNLWLDAIDQAREDGEQNWFTRIVRHQVASQTKKDGGGASDKLRAKTLKGIPLPSEA